jgi:hypothetical protein
MGKTYERIDGRLRAFIEAQPLFFVATAPLSGGGLINLSPKGRPGSLTVLDDRTVAYLDFGGSGAETIAHLRENGRITVMWCAFEGPPSIVRVHGRGEPVFRPPAAPPLNRLRPEPVPPLDRESQTGTGSAAVRRTRRRANRGVTDRSASASTPSTTSASTATRNPPARV